ncbi:restriction endonuclease subunit S [Salinibacterium sp. NSLL150]|nr:MULTISPECIES: restriction endonuclease subunit S [unclassified Salinibacterium]MBH0102133.1 restriction endonuclease subunit S [Salinibacterium sp. NSLL150]MBH0104893.1 restriction endonuclease subunit S [Salinibacterium sp. NSLL16]
MPMWATFRAIDSRAGERATDLPLLSVSQYRGVLLRSEIDDAAPRAEDLGIYKTCRPGDLVLNRMSAYKGAVGVSPLEGLVSPDYLVMRPTSLADPEYLTYLIKTPWFVSQMTSLLRGIGSAEGSNVRTPRIGLSELGSIKFDFPSPRLQSEIVSYLSRETAEIDAFIADQEELIGLLAERRAATISHAVTKGLDPTVPMKDSGVEWVDQMPQHWQSIPLRRLAPLYESGTSVNGYQTRAVEAEIGVLKTGSVSKAFFDPSENKRVIDEDLGRVTGAVRSGSLLINRANTPDLVGTGALVDKGSDYLFLSDKLWQIEFPHSENAFVYYWTRSDYYRAQLRSLSVGASATMQNLSFQDFLSLRIVVPSRAEQHSLVRYLDRHIAEFDATIADAKEAIALSRERRAALISAAVTGKIDVREHGAVA